MNPLPTVGHVIQVRWDVDQAFRKRRIMETQINEIAREAEKLFNAQMSFLFNFLEIIIIDFKLSLVNGT